MRKLIVVMVVAAAVAAWSIPARADEEDASAREWTVEAWGGGVGQSGVENDRGEASVAESGIRAVWRWLSVAYTARVYDFEEVARLPFGNGKDPFDTMHQVSLNADHGGRLDGPWSWFAGATLFSAFEEETDGSLGGMVRGGMGYALADNLNLNLGAGVSAHQVGFRALPLASLAWNRKADQGWSAVLGMPETEIRYRWNQITATRAILGWQGGVWRLADDSPARRKGYFTEEGARAGLFQDVHFSDSAFMSLGLTWSFARSMGVYNEDGDKSGEWGLDPAWGGILSFGLRF